MEVFRLSEAKDRRAGTSGPATTMGDITRFTIIQSIAAAGPPTRSVCNSGRCSDLSDTFTLHNRRTRYTVGNHQYKVALKRDAIWAARHRDAGSMAGPRQSLIPAWWIVLAKAKIGRCQACAAQKKRLLCSGGRNSGRLRKTANLPKLTVFESGNTLFVFVFSWQSAATGNLR